MVPPLRSTSVRDFSTSLSCALTPGRLGGHGFLHDGSPDAQRVADLLRAVLHPLGDSPGELGRIHAVSDQEWMEQQARNMTMEEWGCLRGCRYLLHDRDAKFCESFRDLIESGSVKPLRLPARSPNLNSYAETLGEVGQRRMSVEADPGWRIVAAASLAA